MAHRKLEIVGGPPKWDLVLALFESKPCARTVEFKVKGRDPNRIKMFITGIDQEFDMCAESFRFRGFFHDFYGNRVDVSGVFTPTRNRQGLLEFDTEEDS